MQLRLLLDTHALTWWVAGDDQLSAPARRAIEDEANDILISAASAWEIATKHRLGKLPEAGALAQDIPGAIASQDFVELSISVADAVRAGAFPSIHNDPFDRLLIAQALAHNLILVSIEPLFERYGVRRLW